MNQELSDSLRNESMKTKEFVPPTYLFIPADEEVSWDDALISWVILFHQFPKMSATDKTRTQSIITKIAELGLCSFKYYRWDENEKKYLTFPKSKSLNS